MLVQVSPWKTTKTSIHASHTTRRRKRDENKEFPVVVSFITTASVRGMHKLKQRSSEFGETTPIMAITSDHQITVIGRSRELAYDEFTSLKYASRPGSAGSFLPSCTNGNAGTEQPHIPALFDAKNDRVYAFQHGNSRLCSWSALASNGPDEKGSLKVELAHPAMNIAILPLQKGVIYGTCTDGSIFIARVVDDSENGEILLVEYLQPKQDKGSIHVGTLAELPQGQTAGPGRKRKMSDADGHLPVIFYQVFCTGESIQLVSHRVSFERHSSTGTFAKGEIQSKLTTLINLAQLKRNGSKQTLDSVNLLTSSGGLSQIAAIGYTVVDSIKKQERRFCALLSLESNEMSHHPVSIPAETEQCGLVTETLLAVATSRSVFVYDLETGSILHSTEIGSVVGNKNGQWILSTSTKFATMGLVYLNGETVEVAFSVLSVVDNNKPLSEPLSLASKLASSLSSREPTEACLLTKDLMVVNDLLRIGDEYDPLSGASMENSVRKALGTLEQAALKMLENGKGDSILFDTYESCALELMGELKIHSPDHNPQDALPSTEKHLNGVKKNGIHKSPSKVSPDYKPSSLPYSFVDGSLQIVLSFLQQAAKVGDTARGKRVILASVDAGMILQKLIETGKVSAGLHFENSTSFEESKGGHFLELILKSLQLSSEGEKPVYSPVKMILGMLRRCPDLSERHLVAMLNYMLRSSVADDIVNAIVNSRLVSEHNPYKVLLQDFSMLQADYLKKCRKTKDTAVPEDLEIMTSKVINLGTYYVLERILLYSDCNEATLRVALAEGLSNAKESIILAKMLSDILADTPERAAIRKRTKRTNTKATCQWIAALCDSFRDLLSIETLSNGETYLRFLLRSVNAASKHSRAIIALREDLCRNTLQDNLTGRTNKKPEPQPPLAISTSRVVVNEEDLPGYSVDQMVL
eukprot:scaffold2599_cov125-Cylindrotheca_fusiformis.AAC.4